MKIPKPVDKIFSGYPKEARKCLLDLRNIIYEVAKDEGVKMLEESLKWGEPSYRPINPRIGTAVRIAWKSKTPENIYLFVNCKTSLVDKYRVLFSDVLTFEGNRAVVIPINKPLSYEPLRECIRLAFCYFL
ncbi:DUF1801 domain-containing protein [Teredinibacter sp. KSP-S5-2]|uniref:DUF1801 domain-containing protein n=1 Tax=Teredinibacter sp. KSP-S5-2 TaxID=3034506 RepID=UPI0029349B6E|nr:DUF1801 domain-containing protein [Teredinibacter sp. KSP-S5-2]WNO09739.1 DUF1801 domain-containing protein [Teredinibacter sp. KSP-S5-2]